MVDQPGLEPVLRPSSPHPSQGRLDALRPGLLFPRRHSHPSHRRLQDLRQPEGRPGGHASPRAHSPFRAIAPAFALGPQPRLRLEGALASRLAQLPHLAVDDGQVGLCRHKLPRLAAFRRKGPRRPRERLAAGPGCRPAKYHRAHVQARVCADEERPEAAERELLPECLAFRGLGGRHLAERCARQGQHGAIVGGVRSAAACRGESSLSSFAPVNDCSPARFPQLQLVFTRLLGAGDWSHIQLIRYLISVRNTLTPAEQDRLRKTAFLPREGEAKVEQPPGPDGVKPKPKTIRYRASELYEPTDALRELGLPLVDWTEAQARWRSTSDEGASFVSSRPACPLTQSSPSQISL